VVDGNNECLIPALFTSAYGGASLSSAHRQPDAATIISPFYEELNTYHDIGMHGERLMRSDLFLKATDDADAVRIAFELIDLLNGVVMLSLSDVQRVVTSTPEDLFSSNAALAKFELPLPNREPAITLTGAFRDEGDIPIPHYAEPEFGLFRNVFPKPGSTDDGCSHRRVSRLLRLAAIDLGIYILLRLFAMEINWVTLYKILETLETLMKTDGLASPISETERIALTNAANNFSLTNLSARHGLKPVGKPNKTKVATLQEAFATVQKAASAYVTLKLIAAK
jgi:hypothetical protein